MSKPTINSLSGGKSSSYLAVKFPAEYNVFSVVCIDEIKCKPKDKFIINYASEKLQIDFIATAEQDTTLQAMIDLEQFIGKKIDWVKGISFDELINNSCILPSWSRRTCTKEMKLLPIFIYWLKNIGKECKMNIGFRFDEFERMENFFNNNNPTNFSIPIYCSLKGKKRQIHKNFKWRTCHFPLIQNKITKEEINIFWEKNGYIGGNLFEPKKQIYFPAVSNCVGCFHKSIETLACMSIINPEKMQWFSEQEEKGKGTWKDNKESYSNIIKNSRALVKEKFFEITQLNYSCESENCTD